MLRNDTPTSNHRVAFHLIGKQNNRDAVGAAVTVETPGGSRTKYVQAGTGFLSQSTRMIFFGLGSRGGPLRIRVRWPDGSEQAFAAVPVDHRITIIEGQAEFTAEPFRPRNVDQRVCAPQEPVPTGVVTRGYPLLYPVVVPPFTLPDLADREWSLSDLRGRPLVMNFWATWCKPCQKEMQLWKEHYAALRSAGAELLAVSVDEPDQRAAVEEFVRQRGLPFPVLRMDAETLVRYNLFHQYLLARFFDLQIPTTFLLNGKGQVVKLYRGIVPVSQLLEDLETLQRDPIELALQALPYDGRRAMGRFVRDYLPIAGAFTRANLLSDAAFYYREAVAQEPSDATSWYHLGSVLIRQGAFAEAENALQEALRHKPPNAAELHFALGLVAQALERPEEAVRELRRAAELDPDDIQTHLQTYRQLFTLLTELNRIQEAIPVGERYVALDPENAAAHHALGLLYAKAGILEKAAASFKQALALRPDYPEALSDLGTAYAKLGRLGEAQETFERLLGLEPDHAGAHFNLGLIYLRAQQPGLAEESFGRAAALDPQDPEKQLQYAMLLAQNGRLQQAIRPLERYVALEPDDAEAHFDLGVLYVQTRAFSSAIESFRRATELRPDFAEAFRNLGLAYLEGGMSYRALEALNRAVGLNPQDADAYFALGYAYLQTGQPAEAERVLERVLELRPNDERAEQLLRQLQQSSGPSP
ncbi:tetratricopeptide repeat protein [Acidobacteriia bacterium AH_259_A11_L15]|nr:tetratricopeptide repeat protein [Acidobacteriia bacterium AH_259_A11_L15]